MVPDSLSIGESGRVSSVGDADIFVVVIGARSEDLLERFEEGRALRKRRARNAVEEGEVRAAPEADGTTGEEVMKAIALRWL